MSVADASLVTDALAAEGRLGVAASTRIAAEPVWHGPHLLPCEVLSALRRLELDGHIDAAVAAGAQDRLRRLQLELHPLRPLHERVWELRRNATPYDAWYLALAERLDTSLVTTDAKLAGVPSARCDVEVVGIT